MSKFEDLTPAGNDWMVRELKALRAEVEELRAARSNEAASISAGLFVVDKDGGFRVVDKDTGEVIFFAGLGTLGSTTVFWHRADDSQFLGVDVFTATQEQVGTWRDSSGHVVISDDRLGTGLDRPWLTVPGTHQFETATAGVVFDYRTLPIAQLTTAKVIWEGRIPLVSHPRIEMYGTWGSASGSSSVTYTLEVGSDTVGTWSTTGTQLITQRGSGAFGFDISDNINFSDLRVRLSCVASGTGTVACEVVSCYLRGTPAP